MLKGFRGFSWESVGSRGVSCDFVGFVKSSGFCGFQDLCITSAFAWCKMTPSNA